MRQHATFLRETENVAREDDCQRWILLDAFPTKRSQVYGNPSVEGGVPMDRYGLNDPIVRSALAAFVGAVSLLSLISFFLD